MADAERPDWEIAQAERIGLGDLALALVLSAMTFVLLFLWSFPGLHPGVWNDAAVAAGVRPATHAVPGFGTALARGIYAIFGIGGGETALRLLGRLALSSVAALAYLLIREVLTFVMRMRPQLSEGRNAVIRLASAVGAVAFVAADPVWACGQCLSETTVLVTLTVAALELYFLFLRKGSLVFASAASLALGLLAAETPFGLLLPAWLAALYLFVVRAFPNLESPLFKPSVMEVGKWRMTFLFLSALAAGIALNAWTFADCGGLLALGEATGDLPLTYVKSYWRLLLSAADLPGWLMLVTFCLVPFAVVMKRFPSAADEENFLPYVTGLIYFFCGFLALTQVAFLPSLWFWSHCPVNSQYLLCMGLFCNAFTLAGGIVTLGVDSLCRDHHRLAVQQFGADAEEWPQFGISRLSVLVKRVSVFAIPAVLLGSILSGRVKSTTRQMLGLVQDAVRAVVTEAGDARFLFTDGFVDAAIELEAASRGRTLSCMSLVGGGDAVSTQLRLRGLGDDSEDRFSFGFDAATGLRSWIRDKPFRLKDAAVMMGFDLWKRDGKPLPPMGGLLSRPAGFADADDRRNGIAAARALADRALALCAGRNAIASCADTQVSDAFVAILWRLARMCAYRGEAEGLCAHVEESVAEERLARRLNDCNPKYRKLIENMERQKAARLRRMTPREGLHLALVRADFTLAKTYAEHVLKVDPDHPDANFAMGMYSQQHNRLSQAEAYLKRSLVRRANSPSVYNNLAMIQIQQRRFDDAGANVRKALALAPGSAAVLDTQRRLEEARRKQ